MRRRVFVTKMFVTKACPRLGFGRTYDPKLSGQDVTLSIRDNLLFGFFTHFAHLVLLSLAKHSMIRSSGKLNVPQAP